MPGLVADRRLSPPAALAAFAVAACSFQLHAAIAISLIADVGPTAALLLRQVAGAAILFVVLRPRPSRIDRDGRRAAALLGAILACMNGAFFLALDRVPLGIAVALEMVGPFTVALLGARRRLDLIWVALAATGAVTLALAHGVDGPIAPLGIALALAAGGLWGCYLLVGARVGRRAPGLDGVAWAVLVAAVLTLPVGLQPLAHATVTAQVVGLALAVGFLGTAFPYALEIAALKTLRPALVGMLVAVEPALGAIAAYLVQGQELTAPQVLGIALVCVATAGVLARGVPD